jgi:hypothetical protein
MKSKNNDKGGAEKSHQKGGKTWHTLDVYDKNQGIDGNNMMYYHFHAGHWKLVDKTPSQVVVAKTSTSLIVSTTAPTTGTTTATPDAVTKSVTATEGSAYYDHKVVRGLSSSRLASQ